jgi:hypothetical protein
MFKEKGLSISIFCLSISIIVSSVIIADGMINNGSSIGASMSNMGQGLSNMSDSLHNTNDQSNLTSESHIYDLEKAATYLELSTDELTTIINKKESGIPYIKINDDYFFSKDALDKWLETARVEIQIK